MDKSDTPRTEHVLSDAGVFKGHEGLRQLAECENFWQQRPYGTRLYFDEEYPGRYLHRSVLRAAIQAMDSFAEQKNTIERELAALTAQLAEARRDAVVGAAIERAARDLPEYYELEITIERGAASVYLRNPDGETSHIDNDSDNRLAAEINAAIDTAMKEPK